MILLNFCKLSETASVFKNQSQRLARRFAPAGTEKADNCHYTVYFSEFPDNIVLTAYNSNRIREEKKPALSLKKQNLQKVHNFFRVFCPVFLQKRILYSRYENIGKFSGR